MVTCIISAENAKGSGLRVAKKKNPTQTAGNAGPNTSERVAGFFAPAMNDSEPEAGSALIPCACLFGDDVLRVSIVPVEVAWQNLSDSD